jgi:hypothetical protein
MCNFCNKQKPTKKDYSIVPHKHQNDSFSNEFDAIIEGNVLKFNYDAYSCDSSFYDTIEINFCPMCGRDLNKLIT